MSKSKAMNLARMLKARTAIALGSMSITGTTMPSALDKVAHLILGEAKKLAPVETGALRASGRVVRVNQYQRIVQFGGSGSGVNYAQAVEFGTMRQRPQPFLYPAVMKNKKAIKGLIINDVNKSLSRVARMGSSK